MAKFSKILRLIKLRPRKLSKSSTPKLTRVGSGDSTGSGFSGDFGAGMGMVIQWELRPGGMLVQKREDGFSSSSGIESNKAETIRIRVSTGLQCYGISVEATSTVGELKEVVSVVTGLRPPEQRLLFRGKERDDEEHLHMVGVRDGDKVVVFHSPSARVKELGGFSAQVVLAAAQCPTSIEV